MDTSTEHDESKPASATNPTGTLPTEHETPETALLWLRSVAAGSWPTAARTFSSAPHLVALIDGTTDEDERVRSAVVSRVRLARDRALDLTGAVLALLDEYPNDTETREQYREELARLRRMAEKSDAYFNGRPA